MELARFSFIPILTSTALNVELNKVIPSTQEKLNNNPISNTQSGLIRKRIIPVIPIEFKESCWRPKFLESYNISDIMLARIIETAKPHK